MIVMKLPLSIGPVNLRPAPRVQMQRVPAVSSHEPLDQISVTGADTPEPICKSTVVSRQNSNRWAWIERLHSDDPHFKQRKFHPRQVQRDAEVVSAFGTNTPSSADVLLHYAGDPPAGVKVRPEPVVLIHGANKDGNFWWDPAEDGSNQGLPQKLRAQGFRVYAVTMAHNQDDNYVWSEQLANAVGRVRDLTGAAKVDLVGHSKGGVPARMYASDFREDWMTPYRGDVRRLVLVGAPNGGIDYSFRHPSANYALYNDDKNPLLNAPMSWDSIRVWGINRDARDRGFSKDGPDYWPGQRQLLARWDSKYPLGVFEMDWYTTYHGGTGFGSKSRGIDHFIQESDHFMDRLSKSVPAKGVEVAMVAGNAANIPGILNENAGPSDGLLLVDSALKMPDEANVVAEKVLPLHHKALVSDAKGQDWIAQVLTADRLKRLPSSQREKIREQGRATATTADAGQPKKALGVPRVLSDFPAGQLFEPREL